MVVIVCLMSKTKALHRPLLSHDEWVITWDRGTCSAIAEVIRGLYAGDTTLEGHLLEYVEDPAGYKLRQEQV